MGSRRASAPAVLRMYDRRPVAHPGPDCRWLAISRHAPISPQSPCFFFFIYGPQSVENDDRSEPMKVDSVALPTVPNTQTAELPIIKADDIKTILYLGIRGEIKLSTGREHTVDTYA